MELASQERVAALDPQFGQMAAEVGRDAWSLPDLTMREKAFGCIAADLCTGGLGFPLATHVEMAGRYGVSVTDCRAAIRHLAPYVGYPTAAVALQQLQSLAQESEEPLRQQYERIPTPQNVHDELVELDQDFADFFASQFNQRWDSGADLSPRERALACLAVDVLTQTLTESFDLHLDLAVQAGATRATINAVLLLVAEYGMAKAWQALRTIQASDGRSTSGVQIQLGGAQVRMPQHPLHGRERKLGIPGQPVSRGMPQVMQGPCLPGPLG
jgi:4-carboxymuconolactone decarboxylase